MPLSAAAAAPETPRIETEVQVFFFDTDCAGVVHNIAYLRFIEIARTLLAEQLGLGLRTMSLERLFPVVIRTEIDYKRPAVLADKLIVHGWMDRVDRMRFWCAFEIRRPSDGALIVLCKQALAMVRLPPGKPVPLPPEWGTKYAHLKAPRLVRPEETAKA